VDRVGFEPTTSAMPMPYPTGLDDRPSCFVFSQDIKVFKIVIRILELLNQHLHERRLIIDVHLLIVDGFTVLDILTLFSCLHVFPIQPRLHITINYNYRNHSIYLSSRTGTINWSSYKIHSFPYRIPAPSISSAKK
jgi:hypothetical protein